MPSPTTLITFLLQTPTAVFSVELLGSWDNFAKPYLLQQDRRTGAGHWRGCHTFENITCDGNVSDASVKRKGGLMMGGKYWYYYRLNGDVESYDPVEPFTNSCPLIPGQTVNVLDVPVQPKGSRPNASSTSIDSLVFTLDPADKYLAAGLRRALTTSVIRSRRSGVRSAAGEDQNVPSKDMQKSVEPPRTSDPTRESLTLERPLSVLSVFNKMRGTKSAGSSVKESVSWPRKVFSRAGQSAKDKEPEDEIPKVHEVPDPISSVPPPAISSDLDLPIQQPLTNGSPGKSATPIIIIEKAPALSSIIKNFREENEDSSLDPVDKCTDDSPTRQVVDPDPLENLARKSRAELHEHPDQHVDQGSVENSTQKSRVELHEPTSQSMNPVPLEHSAQKSGVELREPISQYVGSVSHEKMTQKPRVELPEHADQRVNPYSLKNSTQKSAVELQGPTSQYVRSVSRENLTDKSQLDLHEHSRQYMDPDPLEKSMQKSQLELREPISQRMDSDPRENLTQKSRVEYHEPTSQSVRSASRENLTQKSRVEYHEPTSQYVRSASREMLKQKSRVELHEHSRQYMDSDPRQKLMQKSRVDLHEHTSQGTKPEVPKKSRLRSGEFQKPHRQYEEPRMSKKSMMKLQVEQSDSNIPYVDPKSSKRSTPKHTSMEPQLPKKSSKSSGEVRKPNSQHVEPRVPKRSAPKRQYMGPQLPKKSMMRSAVENHNPTGRYAEPQLAKKSTPKHHYVEVQLPKESTPKHHYVELHMPKASKPKHHYVELQLPDEPTTKSVVEWHETTVQYARPQLPKNFTPRTSVEWHEYITEYAIPSLPIYAEIDLPPISPTREREETARISTGKVDHNGTPPPASPMHDQENILPKSTYSGSRVTDKRVRRASYDTPPPASHLHDNEVVLPNSTHSGRRFSTDNMDRKPSYHTPLPASHMHDNDMLLPKSTYSGSSNLSYSTSENFSPYVASNKSNSSAMSPVQPDTPVLSDFEEDTVAVRQGSDKSLELDTTTQHDYTPSKVRRASQTASSPSHSPKIDHKTKFPTLSSFQSYSLPDTGSPTAAGPPFDHHANSKQVLLHSWDDSSAQRMSVLHEFVDDMGYLGEAIN